MGSGGLDRHQLEQVSWGNDINDSRLLLSLAVTEAGHLGKVYAHTLVLL